MGEGCGGGSKEERASSAKECDDSNAVKKNKPIMLDILVMTTLLCVMGIFKTPHYINDQV
ncbi:MAG: hypothetical protein CK424_06335 [Legionella sp.]|nr:MAG: hypothetical protein CK424_06335 [Legionella sp.]